MKFVADSMLGKLARWLRILGYDTSYDAFAEDDTLLDTSVEEDRILLTRDGPLHERSPVNRSILIVHDHLDDQITQLAHSPGIDLSRDMFTRYLECNDPIVPVSQENTKERIPEYVYQTQSRVFECPSCQRVYWRGTHLDRMSERLASIRDKVQQERVVTR